MDLTESNVNAEAMSSSSCSGVSSDADYVKPLAYCAPRPENYEPTPAFDKPGPRGRTEDGQRKDWIDGNAYSDASVGGNHASVGKNSQVFASDAVETARHRVRPVAERRW
jgi:hypothetical protein